MKTALHWLPIALGIVFLGGLAYIQRDRALRGENDFVQLYTGGKLAGTPDLYNREANLAVVKSTLGFTMETVVYTRPPFYGVLLKPLSMLPYRAAYALFTLATFSSILGFVWKFSKDCSALPFFAAMSIPALTSLCGGQDTPFLLVILGASILLTRREKDFAAGLVLSLCAIKFHLFVFIPILLIVKKRWTILGGGAVGTLVLTAIGGLEPLRQYIQVLRDPWINPSATGMPNLHGLVSTLNGDSRLEALLIAAVFAAFVYTMYRTGNYEYLLAASLVCGLLTSFHSGIVDDLILLPVFVSVVRACQAGALPATAGLILTPIPYFMVLGGAPYSAALPLALLVLLGMFSLKAVTFPFRLPLQYQRG